MMIRGRDNSDIVVALGVQPAYDGPPWWLRLERRIRRSLRLARRHRLTLRLIVVVLHPFHTVTGVEITHSKCGKPAVIFVGTTVPSYGGLHMGDFRHLDGSPLFDSDGFHGFLCDSCGQGYTSTDIDVALGQGAA